MEGLSAIGGRPAVLSDRGLMELRAIRLALRRRPLLQQQLHWHAPKAVGPIQRHFIDEAFL